MFTYFKICSLIVHLMWSLRCAMRRHAFGVNGALRVKLTAHMWHLLTLSCCLGLGLKVFCLESWPREWCLEGTRCADQCWQVLDHFQQFEWIHVMSMQCLGRPRSRFQSAGGPRIAARRARRWSILGPDLAMWPKSFSQGWKKPMVF